MSPLRLRSARSSEARQAQLLCAGGYDLPCNEEVATVGDWCEAHVAEAVRSVSVSRRIMVAHLASNLSETDQLRLASDEDAAVRAGIAQRPDIFKSAGELLYKDRQEEVRTYYAANEAADPEHLYKMLWDDSETIILMVAGNLSSPDRALEKLIGNPEEGKAGHPDPNVQRLAQETLLTRFRLRESEEQDGQGPLSGGEAE